MEPGALIDDDPARRAIARFRAALGSATLLMLVLSWPLWTASDEAFPRVGFVRGAAWPDEPPVVAWLLYLAMLTTVALTAFLRRGWKPALGVSVALLIALVLQDQHRFQPWVYQYLVLGLVLLGLSPRGAIRYGRWWFAGLYLHSGLSKLDVTFVREMGAVFLDTLGRLFGLGTTLWPQDWRVRGILAMPAAEIAVATLLLVPRTRRVGLAGALVLHGALLAILGPWGLGHSTIVLVWNVAMMVEACLLFGPDVAMGRDVPSDGRETWLAPAVKALVWAALIAPLGERWGLLDAWPAHALYASHVERTAVFLYEEELDAYPSVVRRHVAGAGEGPWRRLDLTGWSRAARGTPVYPSGRACNGLAEALAARYGGPHPLRVLQWSRADRWTGRRDVIECLGLDAIQRQGDRYWLNAHRSTSRNERRGRTE